MLRVWSEQDAVVCEVSDHGHITDPLVGRAKPQPGRSGGMGLWLVHELCDLVQLRSAPDATVARVRMHAGKP